MLVLLLYFSVNASLSAADVLMNVFLTLDIISEDSRLKILSDVAVSD